MQIRDFLLKNMELKSQFRGIQGSFHHQVAHRYFGEAIGLDECHI